jgi:signal transduction histidine kinase
MFRIKSFQRRILLALLFVAMVPAAVLLVAGAWALNWVVATTGSAGPWSSLAESGQSLLSRVEAAGLDNPELAASAQAHREILSESLRLSQIFSLLADQILNLVPLLALVIAILVAGLSYWAARQLSRGFSRPIKDLVGWTDLIARSEPLPSPGRRGHRGVEEFALLRGALREMADELEKGRREAIQSAKLRSWTEMGRRVAHELKNPLTPMRIAATSVSRLEEEKAQEAGAVLLEEIARLDEMARTFSQFGRMPEGPPSEVDLTELLQGLVQQHDVTLPGDPSRASRIQFRSAPNLPLVQGHYEALLRSFRNLLLNALDAAGSGGEVHVSVEEVSGGVRVEIRDSGPGIPPEDLDRIWEPEFTTKSRGTGLGLPLVRQTIRIHNGEVRGRNHPHGGAVFVVEIPSAGVFASPVDEAPTGEGGEPTPH